MSKQLTFGSLFAGIGGFDLGFERQQAESRPIGASPLGMGYGVPDRVHRLRSLGNAVVPQIAEYIGGLIVEKGASHTA